MIDKMSPGHFLVGSAALPSLKQQLEEEAKQILHEQEVQEQELENDRSPMDCEGINQSAVSALASPVKVLLQALGEDASRDGLAKTPSRVARAFLSATAGYRTPVERVLQSALFTESGAQKGLAGGCGGMVVVRSIDLFATCESCLLPFRVCCHMAYIPSKERVVGLSKLPRVAEIYASRLQNPEKLVEDIAEGLYQGFNPLGVAVVAECWHLQWPEACGQGGVEPVTWVPRTVFAGKGEFRDRKNHLWDEFLAILELAGISVDLPESDHSADSIACPLKAAGCGKVSNGFTQKQGCLDVMVPAVRALLQALGEDPDREALKQTPLCYSRWLLMSTQGSRGFPLEVPNGKHVENGCSIVKTETRGDLVATLRLPFCSQCEHHLLPFSGVAHVGYFREKGSQDLDRHKLQKIVKMFSCRLQVQERLTKQIGEAVMALNVSGVMVVLEASHVCMVSRGIKKVGSVTATMATLGSFAFNPEARTRFLQIISRTK